MNTQKKYDKDITIKFSMFFKIMALIFILYIIILAIYLGLAYCEKIEALKDFAKNKADSEKGGQASINAGWGIFTCGGIAIIFSIVSLYFLFSHRGNEDSRWYCMPIIISPFFLLCENAILHLFDTATDNFYNVTMTIYTTMALGIATFSSLKYSFKIKGRREISKSITQIKPDINIIKNNSDFILQFSKKDYSLCGFYSGKIYKIFYRDSKRTGTAFKIKDLFYPNEQMHFKLNNESFQSHKIVQPFKNMRQISEYDYAIFTNESQCYYFISLHNDTALPIIISSNLMAWLVHKTINWNINKGTKPYLTVKWFKNKFKWIRNLIIVKIFKKEEIFLYYEAMDCFNIPYNVALMA